MQAAGTSVDIPLLCQRRRRPPNSLNRSERLQASNFQSLVHLALLLPVLLGQTVRQALMKEGVIINRPSHRLPGWVCVQETESFLVMVGVRAWLSVVAVVVLHKAVVLVVSNSHHPWRPTMLGRPLAVINQTFNAEVAKVTVGPHLETSTPIGDSKTIISLIAKSSSSNRWAIFPHLRTLTPMFSSLAIEYEDQ